VGGGTGRWRRAMRSALCHPTRPSGSFRPAHLRHGRARCASAPRRSCHAAFRPARTPSARRRSRRRTTGGGGMRVMPPNPRTRKSSPGAPAPRACRPRVGIPVTWPRGDPAGRTLRAARIPIRTPAVAATERGRREEAAGIRMRDARCGTATPRTVAIRKQSPGAPAPRACRLRDGVPAKWPHAEVPWIRRSLQMVRSPPAAPRKPWPRRPPPAAHPHPPAGGRGDGRRHRAEGCSLSRGLLASASDQPAKPRVGVQPYGRRVGVLA
jgi:hypothetical protein